MKQKTLSAESRRKVILSVVLAVICITYVLPVLTVVIYSFKQSTFVKTDTFALPPGEMWVGFGAGLAIFMFSGFVKSIPWKLRKRRPLTAADPCAPASPRSFPY